MEMKRLAMGASLGVAVLMLVGKLAAFHITGSAAILSDAAESVVHIAATGVAGLSLWYAHRAADDTHPYGHGKVAYFSAGFEGAMIFSAAAYIYYSSVRALIAGPQLQHLGVGIVITAALCLVNLALGSFLVYTGKKHNAVILVANGKHVLTDMWTSAGVVIGVLIVNVTDILWIDPVCAILVATNIVFEAVRLMMRSFSGLLDEADPVRAALILKTLQDAVHEGRISGFHQLKHREANDVIWVDVHMLVPSRMTTDKAHQIVTEVESAIESLFEKYNVHVTTHIEPDEHDKDHPGGHPGLDDPYATPLP
jgi:cation diffusion facilitator family transporter